MSPAQDASAAGRSCCWWPWPWEGEGLLRLRYCWFSGEERKLSHRASKAEMSSLVRRLF